MQPNTNAPRTRGTSRLTPEQSAAYIREFQAALRELSRYNLLIPRIAVDGIYGVETASAVAAFQGAHGLPVTGNVDPATWDMIFHEYNQVTSFRESPSFIAPFPSSETVVSLQDEGSLVAIIQVMLCEIGHYFHNMDTVDIDGKFSEQDERAVRKVQAMAGLEETGGVDRDTWDVMVITYNHINRPLYDPEQTPNLP